MVGTHASTLALGARVHIGHCLLSVDRRAIERVESNILGDELGEPTVNLRRGRRITILWLVTTGYHGHRKGEGFVVQRDRPRLGECAPPSAELRTPFTVPPLEAITAMPLF